MTGPRIDPWDRRWLADALARSVSAEGTRVAPPKRGPAMGATPRYRLPRTDGTSRDEYTGQSLVNALSDYVPVVGDVKAAARGGEMASEGHPVAGLATALAGLAIPAAANKGGRFFSRLARAIEAAPFAKGDADQWLSALSKNVSASEREYTGVGKYLEENKGKVLTRDQVHDVFNRGQVNLKETTLDDNADRLARENGERLYRQSNAPKFGEYTVPGGENYREILLQEDRPTKVMDTIAKDMGFGGWHGNLTPEQQRAVSDAFDAQRFKPVDDQYKSPHFEEKNILAHLRLKDRTLPNGEKATFIEEAQSDWHQKGRDNGYLPDVQKELAAARAEREQVSDAALAAFKRDGSAAHDAFYPRFDEINGRINELQRQALNAVPDGPFKKTEDWLGLALKRALAEAAENGSDRLAWTTGEQQAARYDLAKHVDELAYSPEEKQLEGASSGRKIISTTVHPNDLANHVGKEVAERLLAVPQDVSGWHMLSGEDLRVGGGGMKSFYDQRIPNYLRDYGKKQFGAPLEVEHVPMFGERLRPVNEIDRDLNALIDASGEDVIGRGDYERLMRERIASQNNPSAGALSPSIRITPELRAKILAGQPMWALAGGVGLGGTALGGALAARRRQDQY